MFIYFWKRKREKDTKCEQGRGREREGDTESDTGSRPQAVSTQPNVGLEPTNHEIMTWAEVRRSTDWATQASLKIFFLFILRGREREHKLGRNRERGREKESHAGSTVSAQSLTWGSNPWTVTSWPGPKSRVGCFTDWATQVPQRFLSSKSNLFLFYVFCLYVWAQRPFSPCSGSDTVSSLLLLIMLLFIFFLHLNVYQNSFGYTVWGRSLFFFFPQMMNQISQYHF